MAKATTKKPATKKPAKPAPTPGRARQRPQSPDRTK